MFNVCSFKRLMAWAVSLFLFSINGQMAELVEEPTLASGENLKAIFDDTTYEKWAKDIITRLFENRPKGYKKFDTIVKRQADVLRRATDSAQSADTSGDAAEWELAIKKETTKSFTKSKFGLTKLPNGKYALPKTLRIIPGDAEKPEAELFEYFSNPAILEKAKKGFGILGDFLTKITLVNDANDNKQVELTFTKGSNRADLEGVYFAQNALYLQWTKEIFNAWMETALLTKLYGEIIGSFGSDEESLANYQKSLLAEIAKYNADLADVSTRESLGSLVAAGNQNTADQNAALERYNQSKTLFDEAQASLTALEDAQEDSDEAASAFEQLSPGLNQQLDTFAEKMDTENSQIEALTKALDKIKSEIYEKLSLYPRIKQTLDACNYSKNPTEAIERLMKLPEYQQFVKGIVQALSQEGIVFEENQDPTKIPVPKTNSNDVIQINKSGDTTFTEFKYGYWTHAKDLAKMVNKITYKTLKPLAEIPTFDLSNITDSRYQVRALKVLKNLVDENQSELNGLVPTMDEEDKASLALLLQVLIESGLKFPQHEVLKNFNDAAELANTALSRSKTLELCDSCNSAFVLETAIKDALFKKTVHERQFFPVDFMYKNIAIQGVEKSTPLHPIFKILTDLQEKMSPFLNSEDPQSVEITKSFAEAHKGARNPKLVPCCCACWLEETQGIKPETSRDRFFAFFAGKQKEIPQYTLAPEQSVANLNLLTIAQKDLLSILSAHPIFLLMVNPALFFAIVMAHSEFSINYLACPGHIKMVYDWRNKARAMIACLSQVVRATKSEQTIITAQIPTVVKITRTVGKPESGTTFDPSKNHRARAPMKRTGSFSRGVPDATPLTDSYDPQASPRPELSGSTLGKELVGTGERVGQPLAQGRGELPAAFPIDPRSDLEIALKKIMVEGAMKDELGVIVRKLEELAPLKVLSQGKNEDFDHYKNRLSSILDKNDEILRLRAELGAINDPRNEGSKKYGENALMWKDEHKTVAEYIEFLKRLLAREVPRLDLSKLRRNPDTDSSPRTPVIDLRQSRLTGRGVISTRESARGLPTAPTAVKNTARQEAPLEALLDQPERPALIGRLGSAAARRPRPSTAAPITAWDELTARRPKSSSPDPKAKAAPGQSLTTLLDQPGQPMLTGRLGSAAARRPAAPTTGASAPRSPRVRSTSPLFNAAQPFADETPSPELARRGSSTSRPSSPRSPRHSSSTNLRGNLGSGGASPVDFPDEEGSRTPEPADAEVFGRVDLAASITSR